MKCLVADYCQVGSLVKDLVTSDDGAASNAALEKADSFLKRSSKEECKTKEDRLMINKTSETATSNGHKEEVDAASFCKSIEEDAKERAERRKERERKGKEIKKRGNSFFKSGECEKALEQYALALKETPWDFTLHTNRALVMVIT